MRLSQRAAAPKQSKQQECQSRAWISSLAFQKCWMVSPCCSFCTPATQRFGSTDACTARVSVREQIHHEPLYFIFQENGRIGAHRRPLQPHMPLMIEPAQSNPKSPRSTPSSLMCVSGRVKTLHPGVHGGILARRDLQEHMDALDQHSIALIDVVSQSCPSKGPSRYELHSLQLFHSGSKARSSRSIPKSDCPVFSQKGCHPKRLELPKFQFLLSQVVVNLYPFRQTVTAEQAPSYETAVENIDIGGPAMIRAAAKNHQHVTVSPL